MDVKVPPSPSESIILFVQLSPLVGAENVGNVADPFPLLWISVLRSLRSWEYERRIPLAERTSTNVTSIADHLFIFNTFCAINLSLVDGDLPSLAQLIHTAILFNRISSVIECGIIIIIVFLLENRIIGRDYLY